LAQAQLEPLDSEKQSTRLPVAIPGQPLSQRFGTLAKAWRGFASDNSERARRRSERLSNVPCNRCGTIAALHLSEPDWVSEQTRRFQLLSLPPSTRRYKTRVTRTVDTQLPFESLRL